MNDNPGSDVASLRNLTISLAKNAIFSREQLCKCSLSGRKNTAALNPQKLDYIMTLVRSRICNKPDVEFGVFAEIRCRNPVKLYELIQEGNFNLHTCITLI